MGTDKADQTDEEMSACVSDYRYQWSKKKMIRRPRLGVGRWIVVWGCVRGWGTREWKGDNSQVLAAGNTLSYTSQSENPTEAQDSIARGGEEWGRLRETWRLKTGTCDCKCGAAMMREKGAGAMREMGGRLRRWRGLKGE